MAEHFTLGHTSDGGKAVRVDIARLLETRGLVTSNSGGGKSWMLRLMAERVAMTVPTIVIDLEGEFATLREKIDLVLVGEGGEIKANVKSAGLLARRLVEMRLSAVLDLYELKMQDRRRFVRVFIESLMDLPRKLWRPMVILVDEAHEFCPEKSAGEAESTAAIIDLCSRGRKRGYCAILATQRLSKLHKDGAAECKNVFVGETMLDIDVKRGLDLLGMPQSDKHILRTLGQQTHPAKEFFGFGPALNHRDVVRFVTDRVTTTHPEPGGKKRLTAPEPSKRILSAVGELADLEKQADEDVRNLQQAQAEIAKLKREIRDLAKRSGGGTASPKPAMAAADLWNRYVLRKDSERALLAERQRWKPHIDRLLKMHADSEKRLAKVRVLLQRNEFSREAARAAGRLEGNLLSQIGGEIVNAAAGDPLPDPVQLPQQKLVARVSPPAGDRPSPPPALGTTVGDVKLGKAELAVLRAMYWLRDETASPAKVGFFADYSSSSSTFTNSLGRLRSLGLVQGWKITDVGEQFVGQALPDLADKPTGSELHGWLRAKLNKSENALLDVLIDAAGERVDDATLGERSGYSPSSSSFTNAQGRLRSLEAAEGYARDGGMKAADVFFD